MKRRSGYAISVLAVLLATVATVSCTKLEDAGAGHRAGPLGLKLASVNGIPEEYGTLVGVTQPLPAWSALWFQKADKTIVAVFVNVEDGTMHAKGLTIPRK